MCHRTEAFEHMEQTGAEEIGVELFMHRSVSVSFRTRGFAFFILEEQHHHASFNPSNKRRKGPPYLKFKHQEGAEGCFNSIPGRTHNHEGLESIIWYAPRGDMRARRALV
jgi:hypothetical protein